MDTSTIEYKRAFEAYMRYGTPIDLSIKQARTTTHYIWRTRGDGKVRPEHAANNGKIFAWDDPPPTGHPGEDYKCRCRAEPYYGEARESLTHILTGLSNAGSRWENHDFVWHFYTGGGSSVTLSQIGHLNEIANHWAYKLGTLERWNRQIIAEARKVDTGYFDAKFDNSYGFESVEFSHGDSVVKGKFSGSVRDEAGLLTISGKTKYRFSDRFTDPTDIRGMVRWIRESPNRIRRLFQLVGNLLGVREGELSPEIEIDQDDVYKLFFLLTELGGTAYDITGSWTSDMQFVIFKDESRSRY